MSRLKEMMINHLDEYSMQMLTLEKHLKRKAVREAGLSLHHGEPIRTLRETSREHKSTIVLRGLKEGERA